MIWKIWIWLLTANCVIRRSRRMCFFRIYFDVVGQQKKIFGEKNMKRFLGLHDHFSIVTIILSWWWCSSNMGWNLKKGGILGRHTGIIIFCTWTFDVLKDIIVWKKDLLKTKWNLLTLYSKKKKERRKISVSLITGEAMIFQEMRLHICSFLYVITEQSDFSAKNRATYTLVYKVC